MAKVHTAHFLQTQASHSLALSENLVIMIERNDTYLLVCEAKDFSITIVLLIVVLILHIPLLKVLIVNLQLELPRHKLVTGLSISDCILMTIISIAIVATSQLTSVADSEACLVVRRIAHLSFVATTVINSLTISALCFERYVACIHSFRLDEIFTSRRVSYGLVFAWLCGGALGVGNVIFDSISNNYTGRNMMVQTIVPLFVIPSSLIIVVVQITLYMFSRKKLTQVVSVGSSHNAEEAAEIRRKQLKIAAVAGLTALLYLICFLPVCILMLFEMNGMLLDYSTNRRIIFGLRFVNSIVDPFLYGLCIVDTREALLKDARRVKAALLAVVTPSVPTP